MEAGNQINNSSRCQKDLKETVHMFVVLTKLTNHNEHFKKKTCDHSFSFHLQHIFL